MWKQGEVNKALFCLRKVMASKCRRQYVFFDSMISASMISHIITWDLLTLYLHVLNLRYSTVQWCSNFYELLDSLPGEWYRNLAVSLNHESLALWPWMSKQTPSTCSFLSQLLSQIILQILRLILPEVQLLTWRISLAVSRFLSRRPNRPGDLAIIHCLRSLCEIWREGSHVPSPY